MEPNNVGFAIPSREEVELAKSRLKAAQEFDSWKQRAIMAEAELKRSRKLVNALQSKLNELMLTMPQKESN